MQHDRREFLKFSLAASGSALVVGAAAQATPALLRGSAGAGKLKILILGGTGFLGPALVRAAQARGHELTLFNRGRTRSELFPEVPRIKGNRDPLKDEGVQGLADQSFDVVFDDSGYYPRHVEASAQILSKNIGHYVYVSSISAYAKNDTIGADESAELASMPDPTVETMGQNYEFYGALKVLCEQVAEQACPGRTTIVRPGYIVGPEDPTHRYTWWPVRAARGGAMLVPGDPSDPIEIIDVRDLAEWMVLLAEQKTIGVFNACGPKETLSWGTTLASCTALATAPVTLHWLPTEKLETYPDLAFPIWAPSVGESKGFHTWSNARALKAGLRFRPVAETTRDTLAWFQGLAEDKRAKFADPYSPEREAEVIAALKG